MPNRNDWLETLFLLSYSQGGYGLNLGLDGLMDLDAGDRVSLFDLLDARRTQEAEAMRRS